MPVMPIVHFADETPQQANPWIDQTRALQGLMGTALQQTNQQALAPYNLEAAQLKIPTMQQALAQHQQEMQQSQQLAPAKLLLAQALAQKTETQAQNPLFALGGDSQTIGAINYLRQSGMDKLADILEQGLKVKQTARAQQGQLASQRAGGYLWSKLPIQERETLLAYGRGMNMDPQEVQQEYMKGTSLKDMAAARGYDLASVVPKYTATTSTVTGQQGREAASAEIAAIEPFVTSAVAPYIRQFGTSLQPKAFADFAKARTAGDQDKVARYMAAIALTPEIASMRLRGLGGRVGIEAIKYLTDETYGNLNAYRSLLSPDEFRLSQKYIDDQVQKAVGSASQAVTRPYAQPSSTVSQASQAQVLRGTSDGMIKMKSPEGKLYRVPAKNREIFKKNGYQEVTNG